MYMYIACTLHNLIHIYLVVFEKKFIILYIKIALLNPLKSLTLKTMCNDSNDMSFDQINTESACDVIDLWNSTYI